VSHAVIAPGTPTEPSVRTGARAGSERRGSHRRRGSLGALAIAGFAYLGVSILLWWQVWSTHPATVTTCGCGDASLFTWYLEWPAYALVHGHSFLYSSALFHPTGTNLLSNTSVLAMGVPLIPVTLLWGPVATLNVASTLAPVLSALAMFWLLTRWVRWRPAAFVGGLVFGFSPFAFVSLAGGHLMLAFLALLPLMVACLDELLLRQRRGPYLVGGALGLLVVLQFFVGTEMLVIAAMSGLVGVVLLVCYGLVVDRAEIVRRAPHALRGLAAAAVIAIVLLAYPVWFVFHGPAHLSGLIWPTLPPAVGGATFSNIWALHFQTALYKGMQVFGGYLGPALPQPEYLGIGLLIVLIPGVLLWRRDRRLWFFGALGVIVMVVSLGLTVPWGVLAHVTILENIIPGRFAALTSLCAAVMVAVIVDRLREASGTVVRDLVGRWAQVNRTLLGAAVGAVVALGVAAVAIVPMAGAISSNVPLTTRRVVLPQWFAQLGPRLPPHQVVLAYPAPFSLVQSAMTWQAVDSMQFAMAGGSGPGAVLSRAGKERAGEAIISEVSFSLDGPPSIDSADVASVREALAGWGVTKVVVPGPWGLPSYDRGNNPATALGLFTLAVGRAPQFVGGAWVWSDVESPGTALSISTEDFARCTSTDLPEGAPRQAVPDCVLAAATPS
jgi:hypothetical protein